MRVVVDTNVLFEGLTKNNGPENAIIKLWATKQISVFVSLALVLEYQDVLARLLSERRWEQLKPALKFLLENAQFAEIYFRWRPSSPDPGDELVIDCAMNARAVVTTKNIKDFKLAEINLGLRVFKPQEFITHFLEQNDGKI